MANEVYVNVNGTWKQANAYYVNVGGTWKTGSEFQIKVSSDWKGGTVAGSGGLPSVADIVTLDINEWSLPFVSVDAKSGINSTSLDVLEWSLPLVSNPYST